MEQEIRFDLQGAKEIADFLGLQDRRQIYKLLEHKRQGKTTIPIWNEPGIGVVSCKALLKIHIQQQATGNTTTNLPEEPSHGQDQKIKLEKREWKNQPALPADLHGQERHTSPQEV